MPSILLDNLDRPIEVGDTDLVTVVAYATLGEQPLAMRSVANRVSMPQTQGSASNSASRAFSVHTLTDNVNGPIEVSWTNYRVNSGIEIVAGAAISDGAGQVTYISRKTGNPVTVALRNPANNSTTLTATDGGLMVGRATIDAAAGTEIKFEEKDTISTGAIFTQFKSALTKGDRYEFGTTVGALGSTPVQTFDNTYRGPSLITSLSTSPVAVIVGDSRSGDGIYDVPNTARGDGGVVPRILGAAGVRYINVSSRGDQARLFVANSVRRKALVTAGGGTYVVLAQAINDFAQNRTAAQVISDNQAIATYLGLPAVWVTCDPFTSGGPDTPWSVPQEAERQTYNTFVRSQDVFIDTDIVLGTPSGGWRNEDAVYSDWLHHLNYGGQYAAQHARIVGMTVAQHGIASRPAGPVMPGKGTNLLVSPYSLNNTNWTKTNGTIATGRRGPEMGYNSEAFLETTANAQHRFLPTAGVNMSTGTYELEYDLGYLGYQWGQIELAGGNAFMGFDILNGVAGTIFNSNPATFAFTGMTLTSIETSYFRLRFNVTVNAASTLIYPQICTATGNLAGQSHVGDTTKGFLSRTRNFIRKTS